MCSNLPYEVITLFHNLGKSSQNNAVAQLRLEYITYIEKKPNLFITADCNSNAAQINEWF